MPPLAGQIIRTSLTPITDPCPTSQQTLENDVTETVVGTYSIPADDAVAGAIYRLCVWGVASVTGTPTFTLTARLGGLTGTALGTLGPSTASSGVTNKEWLAEVYLACLETGASGTWAANVMKIQNVTASGIVAVVSMSNPNTTVTVSTLAAQDLVWTWTWGTASASNTMLRQGVIGQRLA